MIKLPHKMRGYVRHLPRVPGHLQAEKLRAFGLSDVAIYTEGDGGAGIVALIRALRRGEAVAVTQLHLLAPPKNKTSDRPRLALWNAIHDIEAKGASIIEVDSGRHTAILAQRDAMIREAIEKITHSGRSPRKRDVPGRPPAEYSDAELEFARREWFDLRHRTNGAALKAIKRKLPKWTLARCYDKATGFGPSGRGK